MNTNDFKFVKDGLEPGCATDLGTDRDLILLSIAISLKRIADLLLVQKDAKK